MLDALDTQIQTATLGHSVWGRQSPLSPFGESTSPQSLLSLSFKMAQDFLTPRSCCNKEMLEEWLQWCIMYLCIRPPTPSRWYPMIYVLCIHFECHFFMSHQCCSALLVSKSSNASFHLQLVEILYFLKCVSHAHRCLEVLSVGLFRDKVYMQMHKRTLSYNEMFIALCLVWPYIIHYTQTSSVAAKPPGIWC